MANCDVKSGDNFISTAYRFAHLILSCSHFTLWNP